MKVIISEKMQLTIVFSIIRFMPNIFIKIYTILYGMILKKIYKY